jgi:hypothetical protein
VDLTYTEDDRAWMELLAEYERRMDGGSEIEAVFEEE